MGERRTGGDHGAVLLEAALGLVVVVALLLGVTAVAERWGPRTTADRLVWRAARLAAQAGDTSVGDRAVAELVAGGLGEATLERLIVFRPVDASGRPTSACLSLRPASPVAVGVAGWCNAYGAPHLATLTPTGGTGSAGGGGWGCGSGGWESPWCPATRQRDRSGSGWVGVRLELRRPPSSGTSGPGPLVTVTAVAALDPVVRGSGG